ncbi:hypothetical protein ONS95_005414 [Cadophora gregata]|uniref:uncharacterized protein n=1 Tax=Cadophora gregata TaxID=51156 RepID=UPI0026DDAEBC|nr:uncharacterized protein ONS95_005414 [Cadophora gregata]KAK0103388.1 hypothetical protein ONS95_005414 [Cadophora gregata]
MCTEFGAITGVFQPDSITQEYISRRRRKVNKVNSIYFQLDEDAEADYAGRFTIDLSKVEPSIAVHPKPDNVVPVSEKAGMHLDGVFIGACTTTEEGLVLAGLVLKAGLEQKLPLAKGGRHCVPGSLPIVEKLKELGLLEIYEAAGFMRGPPGCSFCVGLSAEKAAAGETWLSSQNRNFKNRMGPGPPKAGHGESKEQPTELGVIESKVVTLGDFIDTDAASLTDSLLALAPGPTLTTCVTDEDFGKHVLEHTYPEFRTAVRNGSQVVVAGNAFGVGSSREVAVFALKGAGVKAVIARSFAFIYGRNQPSLGMLGITIADEEFFALAKDGVEIIIDVPQRQIRIQERKFAFKLSEIEYNLTKNNGISETYRLYGKSIWE